MKVNKFMLTALFVSAFAFAACNSNPDPDPVPKPGVENPDDGDEEPSTGDELPDLDKPADGVLRIVLEIPTGTECNGIALKGTFNGSEWSGENTYLGVDGAATSVDGEIYRFEAYEGSNKYYTLDLPVGDTPSSIQFKVCLIYAGDGSWEGQAPKADIHSCNWSSVAPKVEGGQFNFEDVNPSGQILYINTGKWQASECVEDVPYNITILTPAFCGTEYNLELVGSFEGWGQAPAALTKVEDGRYTVTIMTAEGAKVKVRGEGSWDIELVKEDGEGVDDYELGTETELTIDFSGYFWKMCL